VTSFEYDALKRMTRKTYSSGGSIVYVYEGSVLKQVDDTVASPPETHVFGYDTMLRMTSATQGSRGTLMYTYANDRVATMQIQGGPATTYAYHPDGSLKQIDWSPVPGSFTYAYTPGGQYSEIAFPNGQKRTYQYDAQGRLTNLANTLGATTLAAFSYGYDMNHQTGQATQLGQRTSLTMTLPHQSIANAEQRFFYDALYQLTRAEYPTAAPFNGENHSWTYDAIGNRLTNTVNAATQTYTYLKNGANPNNGQRLANDGVNAYTYDPAGNTATRTGFTFGYNSDNRLVSISGSETASYTYDYQGRRTSKTVGGVTTTYLYDGLNLIAETAAGQTSYFLNGPGIDEPLAMSTASQVSFLSADALGTIVATNDAAGTVTHSVVFDAWGNTKSEVGTRSHPFTYTGREVGEVASLFFRARYYAPTTGRFSQEDPVGAAIGAPSLYSYSDSAPTLFRDPTGNVVAYVFPPPMPAFSPKPGPLPDFACCSKSAIKADLASVEYQIQRMIRGQGPRGTRPGGWADVGAVHSDYDRQTGDMVTNGTGGGFDTSIPSGGDPCVKYCGRYHEWIHETDRGRRWSLRWTHAQQEIFIEWPAYIVNAACLQAAEMFAKKP
ncbi:MAG: RHS repeat protein, partial [Acidobacteria bacterium]|nr:RHS repeat protein [Acidobacteriota bacterium]